MKRALNPVGSLGIDKCSTGFPVEIEHVKIDLNGVFGALAIIDLIYVTDMWHVHVQMLYSRVPALEGTSKA